MSVASIITAISSNEWLGLAREAEFRAHCQVSEHNAIRLFNWADMLRGFANRRHGQELRGARRARKDSEIRVWRSWEGK